VNGYWIFLEEQVGVRIVHGPASLVLATRRRANARKSGLILRCLGGALGGFSLPHFLKAERRLK